MARVEGLAGLSLRALARQVGMEPQSLYTYFASKNALYDAMFAQANAELMARQQAAVDPDPLTTFVNALRAFVSFCTEDPIRYLLLFQRTIPGFSPSAESMRLAAQVLELPRDTLARLGVTDPQALDLVTATVGGLVAQQTANEPGGQRWTQLTDRLIAMFLREVGVLPSDGRNPRASDPAAPPSESFTVR
jgi:AcrR family transcriptional regulator